jgi:hypothetical protein
MGKRDRGRFARLCKENGLYFAEGYDHDCACSVVGLRSHRTLALVRRSDFTKPDWAALESLVAECVLLEVFG